MNIVFLTGAGISAESGISTFRDEKGIWDEKTSKELATLSSWKTNRQNMLDFYNGRFDTMNNVEPNQAHDLIGLLEQTHDVTVITQNVDDLHERGGSTNVIHLHGELRKMCSSNNKNLTMPYVPIKIGDKHPDGSQLRPFIVWFGEDVPKMEEAIQAVRKADTLIVVGTSLVVYPAASLVRFAKASCELFYVDPKPTQEVDLQYFTVIEKVASKGIQEIVERLIFK